MADLDDLDRESITETSRDEGIELLRQIRLSRRTPVKTTKKTSAAKGRQKKKPPELSADQAADLLKILTGGK